MQAFLTQLPTLIGVMVGVLATTLSTGLVDRVRWRRDQSVRWDQRRLDAYIAYARTIKEIHTVASRIVTTGSGGSSALELLDDVNARRTIAWESVLLLGDEPTVLAGREWWDAVGSVVLLARGQAGGRDWPSAVRAVDDARDRFYAAARESLGVQGGSVAQSAWLAARRGTGSADPAAAGRC
jgi:hypothetical protein